MNGPDHYREAERLLDEATARGDFNPRAEWCLELAKLHTALAHVAATAQASDGREWVRVAGPWFSDISLDLHEQDIGSVSARLVTYIVRHRGGQTMLCAGTGLRRPRGDSGLMLGTAEQSIGVLPCRSLAAVRIRFRKNFSSMPGSDRVGRWRDVM